MVQKIIRRDYSEERETPDRIPPQSLDAEMAVLGSMLLEREAAGKAIEILDESAFYKESHRIIFTAAVSLYDKNEPVDIITLTDELNRRNKLEPIGGSYYLTELSEFVPSSANIEYHANIVLEKSLFRRLINVGNNIVSEGYSTDEKAYEIVDRAEQAIFSLGEKRLRKGFQDIDPVLHETFEQIEQLHKREGDISGVPSGFKKLDEMTAGFHNSEFIIIAGRPSMGKTALALSVARNAALEHKKVVGIFSLEMANYQLAMRMLCAEANIDSHSLRTGRLQQNEWLMLSRAVARLSQASIHIDDSASLKILELRAKARRLKAEKDIDLLIIDYLQLVQGPAEEGRQQEISAISRSLKALAKELDIPVIALSQLSRAVEQRGGDKRPILSDLRDSGAIEQDADLVLFIYRPKFYKEGFDAEEEDLQGRAEIIIGKQRNGPTGTVPLVFIEKSSKFADVDLTHASF